MQNTVGCTNVELKGRGPGSNFPGKQRNGHFSALIYELRERSGWGQFVLYFGGLFTNSIGINTNRNQDDSCMKSVCSLTELRCLCVTQLLYVPFES